MARGEGGNLPHLGEYRALLGNTVLHYDIICRYPVTCDEQQCVLVDIEQVSHFAGCDLVEFALGIYVDERSWCHCV